MFEGHPGDTRLFRGAHSTFWSQVNGLKNTLAYSVFEIDAGVDTGAVYAAGTIDNLDRDTFNSSWKLMEVIAAEQATIINNYLRGSDRPKFFGMEVKIKLLSTVSQLLLIWVLSLRY